MDRGWKLWAMYWRRPWWNLGYGQTGWPAKNNPCWSSCLQARWHCCQHAYRCPRLLGSWQQGKSSARRGGARGRVITSVKSLYVHQRWSTTFWRSWVIQNVYLKPKRIKKKRTCSCCCDEIVVSFYVSTWCFFCQRKGCSDLMKYHVLHIFINQMIWWCRTLFVDIWQLFLNLTLSESRVLMDWMSCESCDENLQDVKA